MEKAQADAIHPGDEKLDCNALQDELVTTVNKPEVQSYIQKSGAQAQKDQAASKVGGKRMLVQTAVTMFSSMAPGGDWAAIMSARAQAPVQRAQAQERLQQHIQQMNEMMTIMPDMMRGQRLIQLGQGRSCEWAQNANSGTDQATSEKK
jgi:hypothetical protein